MIDLNNNVKLAKTIIINFLKQNPNKRPIDFIKESYSLSSVTSFPWDLTPEGWDFWHMVYNHRFNQDNENVNNFLKKYYFEYNKNDIFIDIENVL